MVRILWCLTALLLAMLLLGCSDSMPTGGRFAIDIIADIDGVDYVSLQGSSLTWDHAEWSMPENVRVTTGYVDEAGENFLSTMLWNVPWDVTSPLAIGQALPDGAYNVTLNAILARDSLTITQWPGAGNGYTTIICFDDGESGGGAQYHARLIIDEGPGLP